MKMLAAALLLSLCATAAHAQYILAYDATDGSLTIDTDGGALYVYSIQGSGFIEGNHHALPTPPGLLPATITSLDTELSETNQNGWLSLPATSIGEVLPTAMDGSALSAALSQARYVDVWSEGSWKNFQVQLVPEPTSFVLLGLGGMLLMQRRKNPR